MKTSFRNPLRGKSYDVCRPQNPRAERWGQEGLFRREHCCVEYRITSKTTFGVARAGCWSARLPRHPNHPHDQQSTQAPGSGSQPVRRDQAAVNFGIEALGKCFVARDLEKGGGKPNDRQQNDVGPNEPNRHACRTKPRTTSKSRTSETHCSGSGP